jgi:hypothetical protein
VTRRRKKKKKKKKKMMVLGFVERFWIVGSFLFFQKFKDPTITLGACLHLILSSGKRLQL